MPEDMKAGELLPLVAEVVAAKLSNGKTPSSDVAPLIQSVYQVLGSRERRPSFQSPQCRLKSR
jgi:predicted transcriptional regulator